MKKKSCVSAVRQFVKLKKKSFTALFRCYYTRKCPRARALSSSSGEAAEDNVVEREKFWSGRNYDNVTDNG